MRGYTGHTMVNDLNLIHMGGRTYNPVLGRFMQADPFIQAGANLQNYNRYSYVLNNPLSYTDPSGYLFKRLNKAFGSFAPFVGMALMAMPFGQGLGAAMLKGFIGGGVATGNLRGAVNGAFAAAVFHSIGHSFQERGQFNSRFNATAERLGFSGQPVMNFGGNALTASQIAGQIGAHAFAGGVLASLSGAKFSHGFISAGITKGIGTPLNDRAGNQVIAGTLVSATIGGTTSSIVGGKFANGAVTGAMQHLFNALSQRLKEKEIAIQRQKENVQRVYGIYNDPRGVNRGNGYYSGYSLGSYVFEVRGGYRFEWKVNPMGARGHHVNSDGFGGGARYPENVVAWVVADHGNLSIHRLQDHSWRHFDAAPIFVMDRTTRQFSQYTYNAKTRSWSCSINGKSC